MDIRAAVLPMPLAIGRPRHQRLAQVVMATIKYCLHPFLLTTNTTTIKHANKLQYINSLSVCLSVWMSVVDRLDPGSGKCRVSLTSMLGTLCMTII